MEVGISVLEEEENIFLYVLSVFSVTFSKLLQVTTMSLTEWRALNKSFSFSRVCFSVRKPKAMHFHPLQALLVHEGAQGGSPASHTQWMVQQDHTGNNEAFQSTKNRAGPCATRRVVLRTRTLLKDLQGLVLLGVETRLLC